MKYWHKFWEKFWLTFDNFTASKLGWVRHRAKLSYAVNPLMKFPRNENCFCGSQKKAKRCCLGKLPKTVPLQQAIQLSKYMLHVQRQVELRDAR